MTDQYDKAVEQYTKAIALRPDDGFIQYNLGAAYSNDKNYEQALDAYKKALELNPKIGDAHSGLAYVYYNLEKYDLAWRHARLAKQAGSEPNPDLVKAIETMIRE